MKTFKEFVESMDTEDRKHGFNPTKTSEPKEECKSFECKEGETACMNCGKKEEEHKMDPTTVDRQ